ncbi:MAG: ABC transporter permease subunit [Armatimonadetes bacterium]|nr:ABC transporter permease subunit [Armatimonadota bacterium]
MSAQSWIAAQREAYLANAAATRDFRVQMRGARSVLIFGIYLGLLLLITYFTYSNLAGDEQRTLMNVQRGLQSFRDFTTSLLAFGVLMIAPALAATSIVTERQRQSLDLVFSAPVTPKYYLVGKMISSYRYIWMLLALALPTSAVSVVLGGATWYDILISYLIISMSALVLTAFGVLMSTLSRNIVPAVIYSYVFGFFYCAFLASEASAESAFHYSRDQISFLAAASPFNSMLAARSYTLLGSVHVPNWIFVVVLSLMIAKICLSAAGTVLMPSDKRLVVQTRLHGLLYLAIGFSALTIVDFGGAARHATALLATFALFVLTPLFPFVCCSGYGAGSRHYRNGSFNVLRILDGTPAGGLPFLLLCVIVSYGSYGLVKSQTATLDPSYWLFGLYPLSLWFFIGAFAQVCSSLAGSLQAARTSSFCWFLILVILPLVCLMPFWDSFKDYQDVILLGPMLDFDGKNALPLVHILSLSCAGLAAVLFARLSVTSKKRSPA